MDWLAHAIANANCTGPRMILQYTLSTAKPLEAATAEDWGVLRWRRGVAREGAEGDSRAAGVEDGILA